MASPPDTPIPLHRIQLRSKGGLQVDLECTRGKGEAADHSGWPDAVIYLERELFPDNASLGGVPSLCFRGDAPVLFEPFQLRENTEYYVDIIVPVSKDLAEERQSKNPAWPFALRMAGVVKIDPSRRWTVDGAGHTVISGMIRLKSHAGILDLDTEFGGFRLEVVCQKVGYLEEFRRLLERVAEESVELLLQYDSPVSAEFNVSHVSTHNEAALLFQMRHIMYAENLPTSIEEILGRFHSNLYSHRGTGDLSDVASLDIESISSEFDIDLLHRGGSLRRMFRGYTPSTFPTTDQHETIDTPENRYIKYFLEEITQLCERLIAHLGIAKKVAAVREVSEWRDQLDEMLANRLWNDVSGLKNFPSNSQVLQKRRGYKDILRYDLSLKMALELSWERASEMAGGLFGDLRPVSELYEYWCFFLLRRALAERCTLGDPLDTTLVKASKDRLHIFLKRGYESKTSLIFRDEPGLKVIANLFYNKKFSRKNRPDGVWEGSYTSVFSPDYSVEVVVVKDGEAVHHWLHFDAKYRVDDKRIEQIFNDLPSEVVSDVALEGYEAELKRTYKREDLYKMHTYRDGILGSRGSYILYPGHTIGMSLNGAGRSLFIRHPSALAGSSNFRLPSVGALSLSPENEEIQFGVLSEFLSEVLSELSSPIPYVEEKGMF